MTDSYWQRLNALSVRTYGWPFLLLVIFVFQLNSHQKWVETECRDFARTLGSQTLEGVWFSKGEEGGAWLLDPMVKLTGRELPFSVSLLGGKGFSLGERVWVQGKFECIESARNPAAISDEKWIGKSAVHGKLSFKKGGALESTWQEAVFEKISRQYFGLPLLRALQQALWTGNLSRLPFWLRDKYRDRGLLPVLALSGPHVWALCWAFSFLLTFLFFRSLSSGEGLWWSRKMGGPLAAALLFSMAPGEPSILRTTLWTSALFFLFFIPLKVNSLRFCFLVLLVYLCFFPDCLSEPGFILSAVGAMGIMVVTSDRFFGGSQILTCGLLGAWLLPWVALFFGRWVIITFWFQSTIGFIWDVLWLPLLFAWGLITLLMPTAWAIWLSTPLERILERWLNWEALSTGSWAFSGYRPSVPEALFGILWLSAACLFFQRR